MAVKKNSKNNKYPLYRKVTHAEYTGIKKIGDKGPQSWLQKVIVPLDKYLYKSRMGYKTATNEFIEAPANAYMAPLIFGGVVLIFIVFFSYDIVKYGLSESSNDNWFSWLYGSCWLILLFIIISPCQKRK